MKERGYSGADGISHRGLRQVLIVVEVSLTLILLTSTILFLQSLAQLRRVDPGFDSNNVLSFDLSIPANRYNDDQLAQYYEQLLLHLEKLPGVRSAAAGYPLPLTNDGFNIAFDIIGHPTSKDQRPRTGLLIVSPGYFHTMNVSINKGREFEWQDRDKTTQVIVVNSALAHRFFPNEDPLGKYIKLGLRDNDPVRQIVGVASDVKGAGLDMDSTPEIYVPFTQLSNPMTVILRTEVQPTTLADAVRHEVASLDSAMTIFHVRPLSDYVAASTLTPRFNTLLISLFAGIALVLTGVGLYGVISQTVAYRVREIGIRMALGARQGDILKLILKQGAVLTAIGIMIGIPAALMTVRLITSMLFKVKANDPIIYLEVAIFLLAVALFASYVPARRAMKVDPVAVLR
jgi:predicted permease